MIIKTIKVIHEDNTASYLYHAGPLRSHTLYGESVDLEHFSFKHQNYEGSYLESEKKRVSAFDSVLSAEIISIEVDSDYKFIKEVDNPLDIFERVQGLTTEEIIKSLTEYELRELYISILDTFQSEDYSYHGPSISFIFAGTNGSYTAVDNRTHECFVEQFSNKELALAWAIDPEGEPL